MDAGSITRVRLCSVYMRTECLARPAGAATASPLWERVFLHSGSCIPCSQHYSDKTLQRVYAYRVSCMSVSRSYGLRRFTDYTLPLNPPPRRGTCCRTQCALRVEHGCWQHYPGKTLQRVYAYRVSRMSGGRSYDLHRCGRESSCTPDRVYLARTSYKYVGRCYGFAVLQIVPSP